MFTTQLHQKGLQITIGLQLFVNAKLAFLFEDFMVEAIMNPLGSMVVDVYYKVNKDRLWSSENRELTLTCNTIEAAIKFITDSMKEKTTPEQRLYGVAGNTDQIAKCPELCGFDFQPVGQRIPNRSVVHFTDKHAARELYNAMRQMKLVALRDWLD